MKMPNLGRALILLLSFVFLVSCCNKSGFIENAFSAKSSPVPKESVYFIVKKSFVQIENDELELLAQSTGSGASVLSRKTHSNILTAGHVCIDMFNILASAVTYTLYDYKGQAAEATIVAVDPDSDLCLLQIKRESTPLKLAKREMTSGDRVYYAGYPLGMYMPGSAHHFFGYFSGVDPYGYAMFSLPAAPGSSGSAIVNSSGELISVVSAVTSEFDNLTIGAGQERLYPFLAATNH